MRSGRFFRGISSLSGPRERHLWRPLLGTFGVRSVVCNGETPSLLPAGFVESLKAREIDGAIQKPEIAVQARSVCRHQWRPLRWSRRPDPGDPRERSRPAASQSSQPADTRAYRNEDAAFGLR